MAYHSTELTFFLCIKVLLSPCSKDRFGPIPGWFWHVIACWQGKEHRFSLRWRHNGCDSVSNHQPHHCLLNRLFRRRSKKTSKFRVTGLCAGNSPGTGEFSAQMASNAENVSIWWRHHGSWLFGQCRVAQMALNHTYPQTGIDSCTTDSQLRNNKYV